VAILVTTVIVKAIFFPLANMSYASMASMKVVQPKMQELKEKFGDDREKMQKAMMELYKTEKINPVAGCWPMLIQIPVFFALYKVIYVTIEMRHAPFFGWIQDLSAPDPTHVFNLFGLLPYDPAASRHRHVPAIGVWPLMMGMTMFLQMRMNPAPPDPTQAMIFNWMPLIFMFMLASFPAGLVIYWAWNNTLSIIQQGVIMKKEWRQDRAVGQSARVVRPKEKGGLDRVARSSMMTDEANDDAPDCAFPLQWDFIRGVPSMKFLPPEGPPEVAFAGRSNVGKSSLINAVVAKKGLARTSNTPGRTQELNFFVPSGYSGSADDLPPLAIVDMPGYGFAQAPKARSTTGRSWSSTICAGR
jgi:YidC/Oxa1 family membrane protein insertase